MSVRHESTVTLDRDKVMLQLRRRGLSAATFAAEARISVTTLSGLLQHGRPITPRTARRIAEALQRIEVVAGLDELMPDQVA